MYINKVNFVSSVPFSCTIIIPLTKYLKQFCVHCIPHLMYFENGPKESIGTYTNKCNLHLKMDAICTK